MKEKKTHTVFSLLRVFGLDLSVRTGGFYDSSLSGSEVMIDRLSSSCLIDKGDGSGIDILDGKVFLESVANTENSFKIKLFV